MGVLPLQDYISQNFPEARVSFRNDIMPRIKELILDTLLSGKCPHTGHGAHSCPATRQCCVTAGLHCAPLSPPHPPPQLLPLPRCYDPTSVRQFGQP